MNTKFLFKNAIVGLKANKTRSSLTILGIVIGITSIIMVMSLGRGAQDLILSQIQGMGSRLLEIIPGREPKSPMDFLSFFSDSLKQADLESLQKKGNVPNAEIIMPLVFGTETASFGGDAYQITLYGFGQRFDEIYNIKTQAGRIFTGDEVKQYADVAIIGSKVKEELFGKNVDDNEITGQKIRIKEKNFKIIGVIGKTGQLLVNFDSVVIIPYTTAQTYVLGIKHFNHIVIKVDREENINRVEREVVEILRSNHKITDPDKDDFYINTQAEAMKNVSAITDILTLFIAAIAAISLLVGGVGIMNIMLVSVTERTKEIGLRKAVGATNKNILSQFLMEAVLLTAAGGLMGIIFGSLLSLAVSFVLSKYLAVSWTFVFPFYAAALGLGISATVGLIFGIYPAMKAAKKDPIESLRYE